MATDQTQHQTDGQADSKADPQSTGETFERAQNAPRAARSSATRPTSTTGSSATRPLVGRRRGPRATRSAS
ncbi:hypothetical protein [Arsenicicoccus piscis]|uniref:hypothetical protein n=1 Tax=Arsenicicoccus piscis TaxID=673954 RepID=UPI0024E165A7|nr:hypothetical protein [Arsenicicoccus piscis]